MASQNQKAEHLTKALTFLRNISHKNWIIIITILGIIGSVYGIIAGVLVFFILKPVDKVFAKKILKVSVIIWGLWLVLISLLLLIFLK